MAHCHLVATVFMVGLIWFVQVVHYPLFDRISGDASIQYAAEHQRRTAWVVGLPMLVEGITTLWLFFDPINGCLDEDSSVNNFSSSPPPQKTLTRI